MRDLITGFLFRRVRQLQTRWNNSQPFYRQILRAERYAPVLQTINRAIYPEGWRGFPPLTPFRRMGMRLGWSIDYGEHQFTYRVRAGEVSSEFDQHSLFNYAKGSVTRSVPFALIGAGNSIFGARVQNGLTTAGIGGPVRTTHDDQALTLTNVAEPGHLFSGGYLEFKFVEIDRIVYIEIRGGGYNNFKWINQQVGTRLFPSVAKALAEEFRELNNLPRIEHTVQNLTDHRN